MKVILISGKQGSGKTTLSDLLHSKLEKEFDKRVQRAKFADVIYEMHDSVIQILCKYGVDLRGQKLGQLLQYLGSDFGRKNLGEDIWVRTTKAKIEQLDANGCDFVIIDDGRFPDEIDAFPDAMKVRLVCDRDIRKARTPFWRDNEHHISETSLDEYEKQGKFDITIDSGKFPASDIAEVIVGSFELNGVL